jgi:lipid-A-disaccharide synthase
VPDQPTIDDRQTPAQGAGAPRLLLFTAFEPSGDEHASRVIRELRRRHPDPALLRIVAWGGPKMAAAGAELIERTIDEGVMGIPGLARIREHLKVLGRIDQWMAEAIAQRGPGAPRMVHVPVDSPGANDSICDLSRKHGLGVVHLVAPQVWAWGRWRVAKLRRRTDLLLCLFDFEIRFFSRRGIPARFIGHPFFDHPIDPVALDAKAADFPRGEPKIALFPGSRPEELRKHFLLTLGAFRELKSMWAGAAGVVAATNPEAERVMRELAASERDQRGWPDDLRIVVGESEAVIRWCDLAIVKSGTTTLQVARQHKPMVVFYRKGGRIFNILVRAVLATKQLALPNILARRTIVPELMPYFGGPARLVAEAAKLLRSPEAMERQRADLRQVVAPMSSGNASARAADALEEVLGLRPGAQPLQ